MNLHIVITDADTEEVVLDAHTTGLALVHLVPDAKPAITVKGDMPMPEPWQVQALMGMLVSKLKAKVG